MRQEIIFYPAMAVAALTFLVGFYMLYLRVQAVRKGEVDRRYFLLYRGVKVPAYLLQVERNYVNLFELPVLFYFLVVSLYVTGSVDLMQLALAWTFAVSRLVHSLIHITGNRLLWRMSAFLFGCLVLLLAWTMFALRLATV